MGRSCKPADGGARLTKRSYGRIGNNLWDSKKWKSLKGKDRPRLLYFFFHTCKQRNSIGCFHCPPGYVAVDLGWGENQVVEAIEKLTEAQLVEWNTDEEIVRIVGFLKEDGPTNLKHAESMAQVASQLPDCAEKARVIGDLLQSEHSAAVQGLAELHGRLLIAYPYPIETSLPFTVPIPRTSLRSVSARGAPRTKLPDDWPCQHDRELSSTYWTQAGRQDLIDKIEIEVTKARAHHLGKGTKSADWSQSWVTWYTRAVEYNRAPANLNLYPTAKIHKVVQ